MGIDYSAVMLYGIELTNKDIEKVVSSQKKFEDEDALENYLSDYGIEEIEFNEDLCGVRLSYWYDGDEHSFLAIKSTYHESPDYSVLKIKDRFEVDYRKFDHFLSICLGKEVKGNWYIMTKGS